MIPVYQEIKRKNKRERERKNGKREKERYKKGNEGPFGLVSREFFEEFCLVFVFDENSLYLFIPRHFTLFRSGNQ